MAWIWVRDTEGMFATAAPVCLQTANGEITSLVGHAPRAGRFGHALAETSEAHMVVVGPNSYVSPSWFSNRTQAPTWNYASAQFSVQVKLVDEAAFLNDHLEELVSIVERNHERPWSVDEMGERYQQLSKRIVAFDAKVVSWDARFKLGQDEPGETYSEILTALQSAGDDPLLSWMQEFNRER